MATVSVCPGLYAWTVELENGEQRIVASSSVPTGFASPVTSAVRNAAIGPDTPPPVLTALVPPSAKLGDPNFTLHVQGTGFRLGDTILWNGSPEPTTLVSPTELTTGVNMATAAVAMAIPVGVRALTGRESNIVSFDLQPA